MTVKIDETQILVNRIEKKHGKTIEELVLEREKRVKDAMELREPDRVPVTVPIGVFAARYAGLPASAMYYDHAAFREVSKKMLLDFEPDNSAAVGTTTSGLFLELIDEKQYRWPGGTLPDDVSMQFAEAEYMKADEYDLFLDDPSDFILRYYLPRISGLLAPLPRIQPLRNQIFGNLGGLQGLTRILMSPEFREIGEALSKAEEEQDRLWKEGAEFAAEIARLGFPSQGGGGRSIMFTPFDTISDKLRGIRGIMLDMYRCPDKLLEACDRVMSWWIAQATPAVPDSRGNLRRAGMPLHRGSDGFMSDKQFEKFYWPDLKKSILTNIELGYVAAPFWEGIWDNRLEYLLDLPKGKVIFHCEKTDIFRAKQILGDHMCIQGGVPPTLLQAGSPQDVEEHCRKLIKVV
ncbi:MAG: uroporphyrinogen decarboxylase family protein, partial [Dehalococcoidales bacterium]|nr:uroporphyrinogen decarboxylase family protein [Dehalococcoidales bacterium]